MIEKIAGIKETTSNTFVIPKFWAKNPFMDIISATIPQENPFINPPIMLLYWGRTLWAIFIVTGTANIVTNPMTKYTKNENIGKVLYVKTNINIKGKVEIIEK